MLYRPPGVFGAVFEKQWYDTFSVFLQKQPVAFAAIAKLITGPVQYFFFSTRVPTCAFMFQSFT